MKKQLLTLLVLLITNTTIFAQVNITGISGNVANKQTVTITGSGFGIKIPAAPKVWSDFNDGVNGASITSYSLTNGWKEMGASGEPFRYSNNYSRSSGLNAMVEYPDPVSGSGAFDYLWRNGLDVDTNEKVFISMFQWTTFTGPGTYINPNDPNDAYPQQWKMWRVACCDPPDDYPSWAFAWQASGPQKWPGSMNTFYNYYPSGGINGRQYCSPANLPPAQSWFETEVQAKISSGRLSGDGTVEMWYSCDSTKKSSYSIFQGLSFADGDDSIRTHLYDVIWLGSAILHLTPSQAAAGYDCRYDDIYIDAGKYAWARIALGNEAKWNDCTIREYQIPSAWSATSITATVNQGAFKNCDTAYVYVVDANGVYNTNGYMVIINQSSCSGVGIEINSSIQNLNIYPNPTEGNLNINFYAENSENISIEIVNVLGERIYEEELLNFSGNYKRQLSLEKYVGGIYTVQLRSKNNTINKKIILD